MSLIYDLTGYGPTANQTEWGGIQDGTPPLSTNLKKISSYNAAGHVILPPNGCSVMQLVRCSSSDGHYFGSTAYRTMTRTAVNFPTRAEGYKSWVVVAANMIETLPGSMYVSPFEYHQTNTGGDTGVTPTHIILNGNGLTIDSYGGSNAAGGIGNPGRVQVFSQNFTAAKYKTLYTWHVFIHYMLHGIKNHADPAKRGEVEIFHGLNGTDTSVASLTGLYSNVSTMFQGRNNYELTGLYHNNNATVNLMIAGWKSYSTANEALGWAATLLGGTAPETPPPGNTVTFVGPWTNASVVRPGAGTPTPSSFGPWTTPNLVHAYNPAPAEFFNGNWTTALNVNTAVGAITQGRSLDPRHPHAETLTPRDPA